MKKQKKPKVIYYEDKGQTIYSMAALEGKTPEQKEEEEKRRKSFPAVTGKERRAMIRAAFAVYGPILLIFVGSFTAAALLLYLLLR
ncbi:MAG: hypothetical protein IKL79_06890 [Clostridia bacterium]|nr:hypothetical protein [Clostridia bacterium]MBR3681712.1 hypothetical protein [Clostridia bacterium]